MARYVLLQIDDNADAEAYVASLRSPAKNLIAVPLTDDPDQYRMAEIEIKVRGLYAKPTRFCICQPQGLRVRGAKLGWWVCAKCKLPLDNKWLMPNNLLLSPPYFVTPPEELKLNTHEDGCAYVYINHAGKEV